MDNKKTMLIVVGLVAVFIFGWSVTSSDETSEPETVDTEAVDTESNSEETTE